MVSDKTQAADVLLRVLKCLIYVSLCEKGFRLVCHWIVGESAEIVHIGRSYVLLDVPGSWLMDNV